MKTIQIKSILLLLSLTVNAANYYVKPTGSDFFIGNNWNMAKQSLQNTINNAVAGDTIFVAAGVYNGGFMMREGITVMGGYTANTSNPRERILPSDATNEAQYSILDGGNTQRTLTQIVNFAKETVWDGFVIRNGNNVNSAITAGHLVYAKNGASVVGVVYEYNSTTETGKMISLAEIQSSWGGYQAEFTELTYSGSGADEINGVNNTEKIVEKLGNTNPNFKDNYKLDGNYAANWCKELSTGGFSSWYLPAAGEWLEIFKQKGVINNVLLAAGSKLANNGYWTSNHAGELLAWTVYLENGKLVPVLKYIEKNVRAIRVFHKNELPEISSEGSSVLLQNNGVLNNSFVDGVDVNNIDIGKNFEEKIEVFPNPVRQNETITIRTELEIGNLQLIDMSGKIIFSKKITGNETAIVAPAISGMYVLRIENGRTSKIVVY